MVPSTRRWFAAGFAVIAIGAWTHPASAQTRSRSLFEGAGSGLLGDSDHAEAASAVQAGSSAAILVYENRWAIPFMQGIRSSGGEVVAAGFIPHDDLVASLDAAEA